MTMVTYVPDDLVGWWGKQDTRVRCTADDKVVLTQEKAERTAQRSGMNAYTGKCGHVHVGHGKKSREVEKVTTSEQTQYYFDASILGKEVRGQKVVIKLDWKLPSAKYELNLYLDQNDADMLNVGDRLHWAITRGGLGKDKGGNTKSGQYPTDYFWDWDKNGSSTPVGDSAYQIPEDLDWEPTGDPWAQEPQHTRPLVTGDFERPNAGVDHEEAKWDAVNAKKDARIIKSVSFSAAIDKIDPVFFGALMTADDTYLELRRLRDLFVRVQTSEVAAEHYCYSHDAGRNPSNHGLYHKVQGEELWCFEGGLRNSEGQSVVVDAIEKTE